MHVEKYTSEFYEGIKVGSYIRDCIIYKILCDFEGKIRTRKRINYVRDDYANLIDNKYSHYVSDIKNNQPDEYRKFVVYDEKSEFGVCISIHFSLSPEEIEDAEIKMASINKSLPRSFTFKEFEKISKAHELKLDFKNSRAYTPGTGQKFSVNFFNRMLKTVGKERIYSHVFNQ
jgi:hypothetical protein